MSNAVQNELGSVVSLWRYPVKSMMGEELNATEVTERGLLGDRAYALVDISALLGLRPGDAHVIRNAGGRASTDVLRALVVSQAVMHTREVMVVHHTECAMGRFTQAQLAERISAASGHPFNEEMDTFTDPIEAVIEDVGRIRACPYLAARDKGRGFMYDLAASSLSEIV